MSFSFFSFFKRDTPKELSTPSKLLSTITYAKNKYGINVFTHKTIYHRDKSITPYSLLFDKYRGFYILEQKFWNFEDLRDVKVSVNDKEKKDKSDIKVDEIEEFITLKINEILHYDASSITKFLLLDNLTRAEYESLDPSFINLVPRSKVIFSDDEESAIFEKFRSAIDKLKLPLKEVDIISALYPLNAILDNGKSKCLTNTFQENLLEDVSTKVNYISTHGSGKSSLAILKALYRKISTNDDVLIIAMTQVACDLLSQKLLELIEYSMLDIDPTSIPIITPAQFHTQKLGKTSLYKKSFKKADLIIVDDAEFFDKADLNELNNLNTSLVLLSTYSLNYCDNEIFDEGSYREEKDFKVSVLKGNMFLNTMLLLKKITKTYDFSEILIICEDNTELKAVLEDFNSFIDENTKQLNAYQHLVFQNHEKISILNVNECIGLQKSVSIVFTQSTNIDEDKISYALNRASKEMYLLYDKTKEASKVFIEAVNNG